MIDKHADALGTTEDAMDALIEYGSSVFRDDCPWCGHDLPNLDGLENDHTETCPYLAAHQTLDHARTMIADLKASFTPSNRPAPRCRETDDMFGG